jgi:Fe-S cluster assembly scaffold protein SufB
MYCSTYDTNQLHAAIVELIALENATIKYSTVQNWYSGDELEKVGFIICNKTGLCYQIPKFLGHKLKLDLQLLEIPKLYFDG